MASFIYRVLRLFYIKVNGVINRVYCGSVFFMNGVVYSSFRCYGKPHVFLSRGAKCFIGREFIMHNGSFFSDSGQNGKCRIVVNDKAILKIGNYVGMSDTTITCHDKIEICDYAMLGVGCQIRDTDNHSINYEDRKSPKLDWENKGTAPVFIGESVFIGMNSIILKGVRIGDRSIIGAGSVVTKNIPSDEVWAGNPARFVKKLK